MKTIAPTSATCFVIACLALGSTGCERDAAGDVQDHNSSRTWLEGTTQEQLDQLADQFAGFSAAMMEVGYRYNELYFAGQEENWDLARYHAQKIADAIERGIERRPARGPSAQPLLNHQLPAVLEAIDQSDPETFRHRFADLTNSCNICHVREEVAFIRIVEPQRRLYPWTTP